MSLSNRLLLYRKLYRKYLMSAVLTKTTADRAEEWVVAAASFPGWMPRAQRSLHAQQGSPGVA